MNLRLGGHRRPGRRERRRDRVSIPVLVNLRLGGVDARADARVALAGLNSCSGEPAARGDVNGDKVPEFAMSQFLFW